MIKIEKDIKNERVCQGDIFENIEFIEYIEEKGTTIEISKITFPLVIVLTQDCELQQDHEFRKTKIESLEKEQMNKMLLSVLVAPLYNAEQLFQGRHLSELELPVEPINRDKTPGTYLIQNERPRYHYLQFNNTQIADSVIDFKHYFSVNVETLRKLKKTNYICKVSELYREDISARFANYLSRIGLP